MTDATLDNGCVQVLPGVHRSGTVAHVERDLLALLDFLPAGLLQHRGGGRSGRPDGGPAGVADSRPLVGERPDLAAELYKPQPFDYRGRKGRITPRPTTRLTSAPRARTLSVMPTRTTLLTSFLALLAMGTTGVIAGILQSGWHRLPTLSGSTTSTC